MPLIFKRFLNDDDWWNMTLSKSLVYCITKKKKSFWREDETPPSGMHTLPCGSGVTPQSTCGITVPIIKNVKSSVLLSWFSLNTVGQYASWEWREGKVPTSWEVLPPALSIHQVSGTFSPPSIKLYKSTVRKQCYMSICLFKFIL